MRKREKLMKRLEELAAGRINDAVRLAFLTADDLEELDRLDLSAVSEFKRGRDGAVELKFIDRLAALQWLLGQYGGDPRGEELRRAIAAGAADVWGGEE